MTSLAVIAETAVAGLILCAFVLAWRSRPATPPRRNPPVPKIVAGTTADEASPVAPAATTRSPA
jgi:hypothetical protein